VESGTAEEAEMTKRQQVQQPVPTGAEQAGSSDESTVDVLFRLRADPGVGGVSVVADFNEWSHTADPMTRVGDCFERSIELRSGSRYRYRYLIDSVRWENDWEADEYEPNEYGGDDSVVYT
jgi:1,4-alpha-glucan branching enzyme